MTFRLWGFVWLRPFCRHCNASLASEWKRCKDGVVTSCPSFSVCSCLDPSFSGAYNASGVKLLAVRWSALLSLLTSALQQGTAELVAPSVPACEVRRTKQNIFCMAELAKVVLVHAGIQILKRSISRRKYPIRPIHITVEMISTSQGSICLTEAQWLAILHSQLLVSRTICIYYVMYIYIYICILYIYVYKIK